MALIGGDGLGQYGNSVADMEDYWQGVDLVNSSVVPGAGRCGGPAFYNNAAAGNGCFIGVPTSNAGGYFGHAVKPESYNVTSVFDICSVSTAGVLAFFVINANGSISAWKGPNTSLGTLIGSTAPGLISLNHYSHIGYEWKFHASTGFFRIYVNKAIGEAADYDSGNIDSTNIWTSGQWDIVFPQPRGYMCDIYWGDFSGSAPGNAFLGDLRVRTDLPLTDAVGGGGTYRQWTPSTGSDHGALLDEAPPDDDTSYVASATLGQKETCLFPTIPLGVTVYGLQLMPNLVKTSAGGRQIGCLVRSGGTDATGSSQSIALTNYAYYDQMYALNPVTGVAWTPAEVNAMEGGVEVTA